MGTTVTDVSNKRDISTNITASYEVNIESIGSKNKIQIKQPGYSPLLASLANTWKITGPKNNLRQGPQMHFIATTQAGERIQISHDLFDGTWYRQS